MNKILIYCVLLLSFSCQTKTKRIEELLTEIQGKEIILPTDLISTYNGKDSTFPSLLKRKYKIIVYTDSVGCTDCKMQLSQWKNILSQVSEISSDLSIVFIVNPPRGKEHRLRMIFKLSDFNYPIFISRDNKFKKANVFTSDQFNTFLVDCNNKILLIGSPIKNERLWLLYLKKICEGLPSSRRKSICLKMSEMHINDISHNTIVDIKNRSINMGTVLLNSTNKANFELKNIGIAPLVIFAVNTSCGCTVANFEKRPIPVGKNAIVTLEFKPYSLGRFQKTAEVVCNIPNKVIKLQINGCVVNN